MNMWAAVKSIYVHYCIIGVYIRGSHPLASTLSPHLQLVLFQLTPRSTNANWAPPLSGGVGKLWSLWQCTNIVSQCE